MDNNKGEIMTIRTEELKIILDAASDMYSYNNEFDVSHFVVVAIESVSDANKKTVVDCSADDDGLEGSIVLSEAEDKRLSDVQEAMDVLYQRDKDKGQCPPKEPINDDGDASDTSTEVESKIKWDRGRKYQSWS